MSPALALIVVPLALAGVTFALPWEKARAWMVPSAGTVHLALFVLALVSGGGRTAGGWLDLDPLGKVVLGVCSVLFLSCAVYTPAYLEARRERPNRVFTAALIAFLGILTLITEAHHLGLMWVALEAATLTTAPLLYFNQNTRSLEAVWKYLVVGSVGVALALLGSLFLAYSAVHAGVGESLLFEDLVRMAPDLSRAWLHAAFVLLFVGYGTKMGLAPMHTWKPDAYGEAPGVVGALLAGGLSNCAFLAVLRFFRILVAAGEARFAQGLMLTFGLASIAIAAAFMARQRDFKRMLAYSSVEHMGILVLGVGIGGAGVFGSLLHLVNNGLTKGVLFLSAGNIHRASEGKTTEVAQGALRRLPVSGTLFLLGFFAVTGSPPFGPFQSEFTILNAAISGRSYAVGGLFLFLLATVFLGMGSTILDVVQGPPRINAPREADAPRTAERLLTVAPPIVLLALVLCLGVALPSGLRELLQAASEGVTP